MARIYKTSIMVLFIGLFFFQAICPADMVWNEKLNRLVRIGEEIEETDQEQFAHISERIEAEEFDDAITACNDLIHFFPDSPLIEDVYYTVAGLYEKTDDQYKAFEMYQKLSEEYPHTARAEEILDKQYGIGVKFLEGERLRIGGIPIMVSYTKAIEIFEQVKKSAPFHKYGEKSQFNIGLAYEKKKEYEEAITAFEDLIDEYPNTEYAAEASFKMADMVYKISQRNFDNESMLDSAGEKFNAFIADHPDSYTAVEEASSRKSAILDKQAENLYEIGRFYEHQRHIESAKIYYALIINEYPTTIWNGKAEKRLAIFDDPEAALKNEEKKLRAELNDIEAEIERLRLGKAGLSEEDYDEKTHFIRQRKKSVLKSLRKVRKQKLREVKFRWAVHKRKKKELRANKRSIKKKKDLLSQQGLETSANSFKKWEDSIKEQEFILQQEQETLKKISENLGYRTWSVFAFIAPPIHLANVDGSIKYKEKKLAHIREERSALVLKTDKLIEQRNALISGMSASRADEIVKKTEAFAQTDNEESVIKKVAEKSMDVITMPAALVTAPFRSDNDNKLKEEKINEHEILEELKEIERSLADIDALIRECDEAVTEQTTAPEEKTVLREADAEEIEERDRRRSVKSVEKKINEQYRIIDDAEKRQKELSAELYAKAKEGVMSDKPVLRILALPLKPIYAIGQGISMFLFGIKDDEALARKEYDALSNDKPVDEESPIAELHDKLRLEDHKVNVAKAKLKTLYSERETLSKEKTGIFKSILIFPKNIFDEEKEQAGQNKEFLAKMKKKQMAKSALLDKELVDVREEIEALQRDLSSDPKRDQEIVVEIDASSVSEGDSKQLKKKTHALKKYVSKTLGVLDEEEGLERARLEKIVSIIKKFEGSESDKLQRLVDERTLVFGRLDTIMTTRERYLLVLQEIKTVE